MKGKYLLYGIVVVIVSSLMSWRSLLGEAGGGSSYGGSGSGGGSYRSSGPGSGGWSSGGHK